MAVFPSRSVAETVAVSVPSPSPDGNKYPTLLDQLEVPRAIVVDVEDEPFDHCKNSVVELRPFVSEALTLKVELRPMVSPAAWWSERDGAWRSTDPLTQVMGPSFPRWSTLRHAKVNPEFVFGA